MIVCEATFVAYDDEQVGKGYMRLTGFLLAF